MGVVIILEVVNVVDGSSYHVVDRSSYHVVDSSS